MIVYFLALLELYKQGTVDLQQGAKLAELHVSWLGYDGEPAGRPGWAARTDDVVVVDEYQG